MSLRFSVLALALAVPAMAQANTDYRQLVLKAQANPHQAASLHDAFCFGGSPTPKWVCDQIKAAERPILDEPRTNVGSLKLK